MIVEDGTGVADADAYAELDAVADYAAARGLTFPSSPSAAGEEAIIRGTASIEARYGGRFPGLRLRGRNQGLLWPRSAAYDVDGWLIPADQVPVEVIQATCEAAIREFAAPGSMMPDLARGGAIQSISAGSVSISWAMNASMRTVFTLIDGIVARILSGTGGGGGGLFGTAVRG